LWIIKDVERRLEALTAQINTNCFSFKTLIIIQPLLRIQQLQCNTLSRLNQVISIAMRLIGGVKNAITERGFVNW